MRIAHIVMAHKNPAQLERLIRRLHHPRFDFYIHLDKKTDIKDFVHLSSIGQVHFVTNRVVCNWGGNSFFTAIINSIEEVLGLGINYGFICLMSGQDYAIKPATEIYTFLQQNAGRSFISYEDSQNSVWWETAKRRYQRYHFTDKKFLGRYVIQKILNIIMPLRKFPGPYILYGDNRSSWWMLTTACASYIVSFVKENEELQKFIKYTWASDEFVIPTVIMNSEFRETVVNENYWYIDWSEGKPHPKILDMTDFDKLMASNMLFARKFDIAVDSAILDEIDQANP